MSYHRTLRTNHVSHCFSSTDPVSAASLVGKWVGNHGIQPTIYQLLLDQPQVSVPDPNQLTSGPGQVVPEIHAWDELQHYWLDFSEMSQKKWFCSTNQIKPVRIFRFELLSIFATGSNTGGAPTWSRSIWRCENWTTTVWKTNNRGVDHLLAWMTKMWLHLLSCSWILPHGCTILKQLTLRC